MVSFLCETRQEATYPDKKGLALSQPEATSSEIFTVVFFMYEGQNGIWVYDGDFWPWLCYDSLDKKIPKPNPVKISIFSIQKVMVIQDRSLYTKEGCVCAALVKNLEKIQVCFT